MHIILLRTHSKDLRTYLKIKNTRKYSRIHANIQSIAKFLNLTINLKSNGSEYLKKIISLLNLLWNIFRKVYFCSIFRTLEISNNGPLLGYFSTHSNRYMMKSFSSRFKRNIKLIIFIATFSYGIVYIFKYSNIITEKFR